MSAIVPIAIPGIHERFFKYLQEVLQLDKKSKTLEIGAGHGAFTKKMHDAGYNMAACDLFPEIFHFKTLECKQADITESLPYADQSFDQILAVEVLEHVHDHGNMFSECNRLLRSGGKFIASTPNILSLKSRWRFLFSGFYYSFQPLDHHRNDGLQHLASLTIDQYRNIGIKYGFDRMEMSFDKRQNSSRWLLFLYPFIRLFCWWRKIDYKVHNQLDHLTGRVLFLTFYKA